MPNNENIINESQVNKQNNSNLQNSIIYNKKSFIRKYYYTSLNRLVRGIMNIFISNDMRDLYYTKYGFTKVIDSLTNTVIYNYKHYISIIFPDFNNGYKGEGAWSRCYDKNDYDFKSINKSLRFVRVNNLDNLDTLCMIDQGFYPLKKGVVATNYNENRFLYLNRCFEYLTDSKNIIRINLFKEQNPNIDLNKLV